MKSDRLHGTSTDSLN